MMQCQICGDTEGPFEIIDYNKRVVLSCEGCANAERKKNGTANIRNKRYGNRVSRSNDRSK